MEDKHGVLLAGQLTVYPGQSSAIGNAAPSVSSVSGPAPSQHRVVAELTAVMATVTSEHTVTPNGPAA